MSNEKKYTERDLVAAKRNAFLSGRVDRGETGQLSGVEAERRAREMYPLPKVTRPRVLDDPHVAGAKWKLYPNLAPMLGEFGVAHPDIYDGDFYTPSKELNLGVPTTARVKLWADLIANPTEEVEAES